MSAAYQKIIAAPEGDLRGLFVEAATRMGITVQNVEKDFWVCWTLDALFNRLNANGPHLLFKGGTSLSKAYGLISRFSEDIDVTVFPSDLGEEVTCEQLEALGSNRRRTARLNAIKEACQTYIGDSLRTQLNDYAKKMMEAAGKNPALLHVVLDDTDQDQQSLLIHYPSAVEKSAYVTPSVKIESGAKSALDPNADRTVTPYVSPYLPEGNALAVPGVLTIGPERTFLDKILILHGMTHYFDARGQLRGNGRMSRHYYDVHRLMETDIGKRGCADRALIEDCVRHARMFFYRPNTGLETAQRGSFRLRPTKAMLEPLRRDYAAMAVMIFGEVPTFETVLESITHAEEQLNAA